MRFLFLLLAPIVACAQLAVTPTGDMRSSNNLSDVANKATANGNLASTSLVGFPIIVSVKSLTVLLAGTPADIGTIAIPAGITRYSLAFGSASSSGAGKCVAETAAGTLAGAAVTIRDAAAGAGNALTSTITLPTTAGLLSQAAAFGATGIYTSATLYVNQTSNSANAGTCSFYVTITPLP